MRDEIGTTSGHKDTYLEYNYKFYPFGRVPVIGYPLGSMTSPAMGNWLPFTVLGMNPLLVSGP